METDFTHFSDKIKFFFFASQIGIYNFNENAIVYNSIERQTNYMNSFTFTVMCLLNTYHVSLKKKKTAIICL